MEREATGIGPEELGLTLADGKTVLKQVQARIVQIQIEAISAAAKACRNCGRNQRMKDLRSRTADPMTLQNAPQHRNGPHHLSPSGSGMGSRLVASFSGSSHRPWRIAGVPPQAKVRLADKTLGIAGPTAVLAKFELPLAICPLLPNQLWDNYRSPTLLFPLPSILYLI